MDTSIPVGGEAPGPLRDFLKDSLIAMGQGGTGFRIFPLAGDGSTRRFFRVQVPGARMSYVVMQNEPKDPNSDRENRAYLLINRHLLASGIPLPEIYGADMISGLFIMRDMGDENLQEACRNGDPLPLYEEVIRILLRMQIQGAEGFDTAWTCQTQRYDRSVMGPYEADYFKRAFLCRYLGLKSEWPELQESFDRIAEKASAAPNHFFLHRDFQSRNIMVLGAKIAVIDWQGGRLGPLGYDLASLLIDPYTALSPSEKDAIYRSYLRLLSACEPSLVQSFEDTFPYLAIQRNLQILGAFSYLSKVGGKGYFEAYIPRSLETLQGLLDETPGSGLTPLRDLVAAIRERVLLV